MWTALYGRTEKTRMVPIKFGKKSKGETKMRTRMQSGFTLVEILIVVVILGILAAIVIPQFSQASTDAKLSSLQSNLQSIRSAIALYKIQHNDTIPAATDAAFKTAMLGATDTAGAAWVEGTSTGTKCGPYLQVKIPNNPFTGANVIGTDWIYTVTGNDWTFAAPGTYASY